MPDCDELKVVIYQLLNERNEMESSAGVCYDFVRQQDIWNKLKELSGWVPSSGRDRDE